MKFLDNVFGEKKDSAKTVNTGRYQLFRQNRYGVYVPEQRIDSASKTVGLFLRAAPLFEGGEIRLWQHSTRRIVARVNWKTEVTECGSEVQTRMNVFHDPMIASIAHHIRHIDNIVGALPGSGVTVPHKYL